MQIISDNLQGTNNINTLKIVANLTVPATPATGTMSISQNVNVQGPNGSLLLNHNSNVGGNIFLQDGGSATIELPNSNINIQNIMVKSNNSLNFETFTPVDIEMHKGATLDLTFTDTNMQKTFNVKITNDSDDDLNITDFKKLKEVQKLEAFDDLLQKKTSELTLKDYPLIKEYYQGAFSLKKFVELNNLNTQDLDNYIKDNITAIFGISKNEDFTPGEVSASKKGKDGNKVEKSDLEKLPNDILSHIFDLAVNSVNDVVDGVNLTGNNNFDDNCKIS